MAEDWNAGAQIEFGEDYAAGVDAVDAALGRRLPAHRGYLPENPRRAAANFVYPVGLPSIAAIGGVTGTSQKHVNTPFQPVDFVVSCTAATFTIDLLNIGDAPMLIGSEAVPADMFLSTVQNRFVRLITAQSGWDVTVKATNITTSTLSSTIVMAIKAKSYRRS